MLTVHPVSIHRIHSQIRCTLWYGRCTTQSHTIHHLQFISPKHLLHFGNEKTGSGAEYWTGGPNTGICHRKSPTAISAPSSHNIICDTSPNSWHRRYHTTTPTLSNIPKSPDISHRWHHPTYCNTTRHQPIYPTVGPEECRMLRHHPIHQTPSDITIVHT